MQGYSYSPIRSAALLCTGLGAILTSDAADLTGHRNPNIVLIYVDDMGYGDMSITGATGFRTPHLDRLAHEGMLFTQFYSPAPVSSASRAGLMTGCYPVRVGVPSVIAATSKSGLSPEIPVIPEMLKKIGYATAMVEKWHLGSALQYMPFRRGFDQFFGLPYSNDMWPYGHEVKRGEIPSRKTEKVGELTLMENETPVREIRTLDDMDCLTTLYTERAIQFIAQQKRQKPFFLYVAHSMPHVPLAVSEKFRGKSEYGPYGDVMMELDWSVGEILNALKKNGLEKNTLVIFTSDNGPWISYGTHQGSTAAMKEAKHTCFEGGQRMPCLMRWPGVIPEGSVCNRLASGIDLLPTIASITGAPLLRKQLDGVDISPLLQGDFSKELRKFFFYDGTKAVRDERFKLVRPLTYRSYEGLLPGMNGAPGKRKEVSTEWALYDLHRDPGERYNVIEQYPQRAEQLKQALNEMAKELSASKKQLTN
nr:sulfatase [Alistipes senegalensis]